MSAVKISRAARAAADRRRTWYLTSSRLSQGPRQKRAKEDEKGGENKCEG